MFFINFYYFIAKNACADERSALFYFFAAIAFSTA